MFEDEDCIYSKTRIRKLTLHSSSERQLVYSVGTEHVWTENKERVSVKISGVIERFNTKTNQWEYLITISKPNNDNYVWMVVRNPVTPVIQYEI